MDYDRAETALIALSHGSATLSGIIREIDTEFGNELPTISKAEWQSVIDRLLAQELIVRNGESIYAGNQPAEALYLITDRGRAKVRKHHDRHRNLLAFIEKRARA